MVATPANLLCELNGHLMSYTSCIIIIIIINNLHLYTNKYNKTKETNFL